MNGKLSSELLLYLKNSDLSEATDPFTITYPTAVQTSLHSGASVAKFDPSGRFVAAGRPDGSARIWDLDTKSTVRWLDGHVKGVIAVECVQDFRRARQGSK